MAGRPQKPRARLADRRPGRKTGLVLAFKRPDEPPPEMPAPLNGKWRVETVTLWQAFWTAPIAQVVDRESDMPRLLRWIAYWDEWFRAMRAFRRRRMVEGSMGQPVINPLSAYIAVVEGKIERIEEKFGLTPLDRMRLGISFGEAQRSLADMNADLDDDADADEYTLPVDFQPPASAKAGRKKAKRRGAAPSA